MLGEEYVIPTYGVWSSFDDIDFSSLPNQFVLKGTHDCKSVIVCDDIRTFDIDKAKARINKSLKRNYYYKYREWAYLNVPPRIIAEKRLVEANSDELTDYKVMCFDGEPLLIQVHLGRFSNHTQDFYDLDWNLLDIYQGMPRSNTIIPKPVFLDEMISYSKRLSEGFPEVRVDWYYADNHLYFGEMTFYDAAGWDDFYPDEWNKKLGDLIPLPNQ